MITARMIIARLQPLRCRSFRVGGGKGANEAVGEAVGVLKGGVRGVVAAVVQALLPPCAAVAVATVDLPSV